MTEELKEGDLVYVTGRRSKHPFKRKDALWIVNIAGGFMLTCQSYHRDKLGYLFYDEVTKKRPKGKR